MIGLPSGTRVWLVAGHTWQRPVIIPFSSSICPKNVLFFGHESRQSVA